MLRVDRELIYILDVRPRVVKSTAGHGALHYNNNYYVRIKTIKI